MDPLRCARLCAEAYERSDHAVDGVEIVEDGDTVAFRGTTFDGADIIRDLRALPWWSGEVGTWVHRGFLVSARSILPLIEPGLVLTGHSKGGAEALIAGALLAAAGLAPKAIVTFGAPRAGFKGLGSALSSVSVVQFVQGNDIVPRHPWPLWGYRHVAPPERIGRPSGNDLNDHRMAAYLNAMEKRS